MNSDQCYGCVNLNNACPVCKPRLEKMLRERGLLPPPPDAPAVTDEMVDGPRISMAQVRSALKAYEGNQPHGLVLTPDEYQTYREGAMMAALLATKRFRKRKMSELTDLALTDMASCRCGSKWNRKYYTACPHCKLRSERVEMVTFEFTVTQAQWLQRILAAMSLQMMLADTFQGLEPDQVEGIKRQHEELTDVLTVIDETLGLPEAAQPELDLCPSDGGPPNDEDGAVAEQRIVEGVGRGYAAPGVSLSDVFGIVDNSEKDS
jgi:hypothetical protein